LPAGAPAPTLRRLWAKQSGGLVSLMAHALQRDPFGLVWLQRRPLTDGGDGQQTKDTKEEMISGTGGFGHRISVGRPFGGLQGTTHYEVELLTLSNIRL
jgi:hypothetical protein